MSHVVIVMWITIVNSLYCTWLSFRACVRVCRARSVKIDHMMCTLRMRMETKIVFKFSHRIIDICMCKSHTVSSTFAYENREKNERHQDQHNTYVSVLADVWFAFCCCMQQCLVIYAAAIQIVHDKDMADNAITSRFSVHDIFFFLSPYSCGHAHNPHVPAIKSSAKRLKKKSSWIERNQLVIQDHSTKHDKNT